MVKIKHITALHLQIFNTQNYILFKISALNFFLIMFLKILQISASIFLQNMFSYKKIVASLTAKTKMFTGRYMEKGM